MATYSSILACDVSWTEEPGKLQSMGLQRSRTRLSDWTTTIHSLAASALGTKSRPSLGEQEKIVLISSQENAGATEAKLHALLRSYGQSQCKADEGCLPDTWLLGQMATVWDYSLLEGHFSS